MKNLIICSECEHCDNTRINDSGQVRCKRFSKFVDNDDNCDEYSYTEDLRFFKRSDNNE